VQIPERAALDEDVVEGSSGVEVSNKPQPPALDLGQIYANSEMNEISMNPQLKQAGAKYGTELVAFAKDTVKDKVAGVIEESPIGLITELFQIGKDGSPIFSDGPSPAETMRALKEKKVMGIRVHSDLEVMFTGMAFIIRCEECIA
jgi:hypothetical protein